MSQAAAQVDGKEAKAVAAVVGEEFLSYEKITELAEERIRRFMFEALLAAEQSSECEVRLYRNWAYGVFLMWLHLAQSFGVSYTGDYMRLSDLTDGKALQ